ncbi:hypothetical protein QTP70_016214 [Hemibagrus guttatus]|uniref:Sushi domain-containing protein n=1 Tax=Hemibagrus guttatus TaxID=175788 RepID=A0AAE0QFB2_9TELE|nr:hypothetical protein QTP70_016214 [Hemibagrus guttatus]
MYLTSPNNATAPSPGLKEKMRETPRYRLIIFLTCLLKVAEIQAQCERPIVGENMIMTDDQLTFPNGSTVTFKCSTGYRPVDPSASTTITCVGTEWTTLGLNCTKKTCGSLPDFPNGKYTYPDGILFGATAIAQCNPGYSLVGLKTRNCRDNGWDGRDPVCEVVKCEPPPSIQNGTFEPVDDVYNYDQVVTYSCTGDYTLIGESTVVCSVNGTFHPPPPQCLLVECETPDIKNAVRVEGKPPPYRYKNFVRYQCNKGFTMNGTGHIVCEENGWNPPPPECIAQCERPIVGENMIMTDDQLTFPNGSTVTFKCSTGYRPVDPSASTTITCVGTEWTTLGLNCTKKTCGSLPDFPNGKYTYPDGILFGATAIAQCNPGYSLVGVKTRNCRDNGWDGRDPVCEVVKCEPPPSIQNGTFEPVDEVYNYDQVVTYSCTGDYTLIGESTVVCSVNGTFHPPPPQCLLVECETPDIKNAVRVEGKPPPYRYKNFVRYQCNKGFTMNGTGHIVCEENGWNPPPPECIVIRIPNPPTTAPPSAISSTTNLGDLSHVLGYQVILACNDSTFTAQCKRPFIGENRILTEDSGQSTYPEGFTLTYKCSTGYRPVQAGGLKSITCRGEQWSELQLQCQLKSCGSLGELANGKYLTPNGILFGATATAQCNDGFVVVGEKSRNCRDDGWDGRDPVCEAVKCEKPPDIQNGMFDPVIDVYDYDEGVTYECNNEYTLVGESTISCSKNGTFPPPPQCLIISCDAPTIKNAHRIEGKAPPYKYKNFVRYRCNLGYTLKGSDSLTCDINGWNPPPPECIEDKIAPKPSPIPGTTAPPSEKVDYKVVVGVVVGVGLLGLGIVGLVFYLKKRTLWGMVPTRNEGST